MATDTQNQHYTTQMGSGRVIKLKTMRASEEEKRARIRERQRLRYLAMQQTMLQAVEQVVKLPEMPKREETAAETIAETPCSQPAMKHRDVPSLKVQAERVVGSISSWVDRMRSFVLEES